MIIEVNKTLLHSSLPNSFVKYCSRSSSCMIQINLQEKHLAVLKVSEVARKFLKSGLLREQRS